VNPCLNRFQLLYRQGRGIGNQVFNTVGENFVAYRRNRTVGRGCRVVYCSVVQTETFFQPVASICIRRNRIDQSGGFARGGFYDNGVVNVPGIHYAVTSKVNEAAISRNWVFWGLGEQITAFTDLPGLAASLIQD